MSFTSDNCFGADPAIIEAIIAANTGAAGSYDHDTYSVDLKRRLTEVFELRLAHEHGHSCKLHCDQRSVPSFWHRLLLQQFSRVVFRIFRSGLFHWRAKFIASNSSPSKIDVAAVRAEVSRARGNLPHAGNPSGISVTQWTELGFVYTLDEQRVIGATARELGLRFHMDGARFANALVRLGDTPVEMTWKIGVDVLSFGATKNGGLKGETIVVFNQECARELSALHKRAGQLLSKPRFLAYLRDRLWIALARHANGMAQKLGQAIASLASVSVAQEVETRAFRGTLNSKIWTL
jgi:threonine aldolase